MFFYEKLYINDWSYRSGNSNNREIKMDLKEKVLKMLNEYYGESRSDEHKEEVADFVEGFAADIHKAIEEDMGIEDDDEDISYGDIWERS